MWCIQCSFLIIKNDVVKYFCANDSFFDTNKRSNLSFYTNLRQFWRTKCARKPNRLQNNCNKKKYAFKWINAAENETVAFSVVKFGSSKWFARFWAYEIFSLYLLPKPKQLIIGDPCQIFCNFIRIAWFPFNRCLMVVFFSLIFYNDPLLSSLFSLSTFYRLNLSRTSSIRLCVYVCVFSLFYFFLKFWHLYFPLLFLSLCVHFTRVVRFQFNLNDQV